MFSNLQTQKRSHESPMDWEWQTKGPTDPNSPFPQFKLQGQKPSFESPKPSSSFIGASSTPAAPFRNPSFTTPRKPFDPDLFSEASGAESSPADNADIDTPERPTTSSAMTTFSGNSEKKPLFGKYGAGFLGSSPGRAEQRRGKYGSAIVHKVRKRKRIERDYAVVKSLRNDSGSESDSGDSRPKSRASNGKGGNQQNWFSSFISGVESRPTLPETLSKYTQLGMNFFLLSLFIFSIYTFWSAVKSDIDKEAENLRAEVIAEMTKCSRDYVENACGHDRRLPALESVCHAWGQCMNRDPNSIGKAKVSAQTFAQIFNNFVEPISYKAMIFVVIIATSCIVANNLAFGMFRAKASMPAAQPYFPPPPQNFQWGVPPQTPQHNNVAHDTWTGQNFQAIMPSQTPSHKSPSKGSRSPSKAYRSPSKGELY
ncbi:hypothetical protein G7Y89_g3143 [Cudoniella acicularis]|uniref:Brl1/Brr6 domain-containing protein n=1 Tax=Cudoniella acicularis TaxID=354080 RepID=A0A8H4W5G5_9HELO|nr:hypothetical protein G7Y89_g3143 [Cudoniella acicularis]